METITCRRADGREIALDRLPSGAGASDNAETVRAEEIVLSVPDGRNVTTLINATPIHGPDGALASVVVTLQDLAPLRELERMRAEFLGMVSHELRAPLTSIKGSAATVLRASRIFGFGRGGAVLPHHRRAGRPHGQPDRGPARRPAPGR